MVAEAQAPVSASPRAEAKGLIAGGPVEIDLRDSSQIAASGKVNGALAIDRGVLEFKAEPSMPTHEPRCKRIAQ